jgi:hypothetical protein
MCSGWWLDNRIKPFGSHGARSHDHGTPIINLGSDSINHIDLRALQLYLSVSVYPDGGNQPVGVSRSTTFATRSW